MKKPILQVVSVYLRKAWENGVVLAGISAGANCWFEECVTDSIPGSLTPFKCLGFLEGSCCPHYDGEKHRRPSYHKLLQEDRILGGIAIDDHAAAHYIGHRLEKIIRANETGTAYKVAKIGNEICETPFKKRTNQSPAKEWSLRHTTALGKGSA